MLARRTLRRTTAAIVLAATLLALANAPMAHATTQEDAGFVAKINASRTAAGLRALTARSDLHTMAQRQADRQAAADGGPFHNAHLAQEGGTNWRILGENVGVGSDVAVLHTAFMNSPHHRANIMSTQFTEVGIGTARAKSGRLFVAEVFRLPATQTAAASAPATTAAPKRRVAAVPATVPPTTAPPATVPPTTVPPTTVAPPTTAAPTTTVAPVADETAIGALEAISQSAAAPTVATPILPPRAAFAAELAAGLLILVVGLQAFAVRRQLAASA